ncbi:MAG: hypothetical protein HKN23_19035 [Verrucomicrobiales bacterium]|nr:hypothetical protein [Verrucomicrobiales bacterium]
METAKRRNRTKINTIYWITAMAVPIILDLGLEAFSSEGARFPWVILIPFLFVGLLIASNKLITEASGDENDS